MLKPSERIFIVGGGTSLKGFDFGLLDNEHTIAVNESIFNLNFPTYFITVDYEWLNRKKGTDAYSKFRKSKAQKFMVLNTSPQSKLEYHKNAWTHLGLAYDLTDYDVVVQSPKSEGFGNFHDFRHGECSGYCALQLALIMGYKKIYLMGIDLKRNDAGDVHYHNEYLNIKRINNYYNDKLELFYKMFAKGILNYTGKSKFYSCSPVSRLNGIIKYKNINEVLSAIQ